MSFSHLDESHQPAMVDVGGKTVTRRMALARAEMLLPAVVADALAAGDIHGPKGPVFQTARLAGTMAAKKTWDLIPLCHPLLLDRATIDINAEKRADGTALVRIDCEVRVTGRTGVEMEALTGASIAALTIYDMCKALSHEMVIRETRLIHKEGGRRLVVDGRLQSP